MTEASADTAQALDQSISKCENEEANQRSLFAELRDSDTRFDADLEDLQNAIQSGCDHLQSIAQETSSMTAYVC